MSPKIEKASPIGAGGTGPSAENPLRVVPAGETERPPTPPAAAPVPERQAPPVASAVPVAPRSSIPVSAVPQALTASSAAVLKLKKKAASNALLEYNAVAKKIQEKMEVAAAALAEVRAAGGTADEVEMLIMMVGINPGSLPEGLSAYTWD